MRNVSERGHKVLGLLEGYSFNAMEVCRALNGQDPKAFRGCYYKFDLNRRGPRCRMKERGCPVRSDCVDHLLRGLQKRGLVQSVKLRWFDGRDKGTPKSSLQLDLFRFYYTSREGLARKLMDDIKTHVLEESL